MAIIKSTDISVNAQRNLLCRLVFLAILCSLIYGYLSGVMLFQMQSPVLAYLYLDPAFWISFCSGVTAGIASSFLFAITLDLMLVFSCLLCIAFPSRTVFPRIFFISYFLYFLIFNTYGGHQTLNKAGILLMPLAFVVKPTRFTALWEGLRYYTIYIFASAFTWKLIRLSWLEPQQGERILKKNLATYLYHHPDSFRAGICFKLLAHPLILQILFIAAFLIEGSFILGLFTKRYDRYLLSFMFLLVAGFWFMADAFFGELLVFGFTLLPLKALTSPEKSLA